MANAPDDPLAHLQLIPKSLLIVAAAEWLESDNNNECSTCTDDLEEHATAMKIPAICSRANIEYVEQSVQQLLTTKRNTLLSVLSGSHQLQTAGFRQTELPANGN